MQNMAVLRKLDNWACNRGNADPTFTVKRSSGHNTKPFSIRLVVNQACVRTMRLVNTTGDGQRGNVTSVG